MKGGESMSNILSNPKSREEIYLYALATGNTTNLPAPKGRKEEYLYYLCVNGGTGGAGFIKVGEVTSQSQLPPAYTGSKGDYYEDLTTGNWWVWNGTTFYEKVAEGKPHIHTQTLATTTWNIQHNLRTQYPTILIIDDKGDRQEGIADYDNATPNNIKVTFLTSIKGKAIVKK